MSSRDFKKTLVALLALAWCFGLVVWYYAGHKPFTPELALAVGLSTWRLLAAATLIVAGGALGKRLIRRETLNPLALLCVEAALGMGLLALALLAAGSLAGLPAWLPGATLVILLAVLRREALAWLQQWRSLPLLWHGDGRFVRMAYGLAGLALLPALVIALAPPAKFDALVYHLTLPSAYLEQSRITYLPWLVMSGMPQTSEMLYAWALSLGGSPAPAVLSWLVNLVALAGLAGFLYERFGRRPAAAGMAALLAGFSLAACPSWAYTECFGFWFGVTALVTLDRWAHTARREELWLAGIFAGFALGAKYPYGVLGLACFGVIAFLAARLHRPFLPALFHFGLPAALVVLPWLGRNLLMTGNPLYPLLFEGGAMTALRLNQFTGLPTWGNWQDLLLLPLRATIDGYEGASGYGSAIGPLLLGLGLLALPAWKAADEIRRHSLETAGAAALMVLLVWAFGNQASGFLIQTRFYFPLFPAFACLAAAGFGWLSGLEVPQVRIGRIFSALALLALALNVVETGSGLVNSGALQVILGQKTGDAYLTDTLGWYYPAVQAARELPGAKVLLLFEPRSYYCRPTCYPDETLDRWRRDWTRLSNSYAVLDSWRNEGFTHFLYYRAGAEFMRETGDIHYNPQLWQALDQTLNGLNPVTRFGEAYELYSLEQ